MRIRLRRTIERRPIMRAQSFTFARGDEPKTKTEESTAPRADEPTTREQPKKRRGFAAMDRAAVRAIARKGGVAAHERGTAHRFTTEAARRDKRAAALRTARGAGRSSGRPTVRQEPMARAPRGSCRERRARARCDRGAHRMGCASSDRPTARVACEERHRLPEVMRAWWTRA
jgi:hypothetical protein